MKVLGDWNMWYLPPDEDPEHDHLWAKACYGDSMFDRSGYERMVRLIDKTVFSHEDKEELHFIVENALYEGELTNKKVEELGDYLYAHRRGYKEMANANQTDITRHIKEVCQE